MKASCLNVIFRLLIFPVAVCLTSCLQDDIETIRLINETVKKSHPNIPSDNIAGENPSITTINTSIPNVNYKIEDDGVGYVVRIDMTGVKYPNTLEWLRLEGTGSKNQNIWLSVDCQPKGIQVYNTIDDVTEEVVVKNDFVFLVDNSGSMGEEADAIARDILSWAQTLTEKYDMQFGCVGYNGLITGAINLTSYEMLYQFLNRSAGINRTEGFAGTDASYLQSQISSYNLASQNECGMAALRYADRYFKFRQGANRIYVNFTDEYNFPAYKSQFSVDFLSSQANWPSVKGTVHTVYSGSTSASEVTNSQEKPWRMSEYTGGTTLYCSSDFSGIKLIDLPVTSAIQNSYVIRFANIEEFMDGDPHSVKITIYADDGRVQAERTFMMTFK